MKLISILLFISLFNSPSHPHRIDSLLLVLDNEIERADTYFEQRERSIREHKIMFAFEPTNDAHAYELAVLYAPYECDSAYKYAQMAIQLAGSNVPEKYTLTLENMQRVVHGGQHSLYIRHPEEAYTENTHEYAIASYYRAIDCKEAGDSLMYVEWLIRSAITDVRCGICDNGSSWLLSTILATNGDIDRAYRYINYSLSNMLRFNSSRRISDITPVESTIRMLWQKQQKHAKRSLEVGLTIVLIALICLAFIAFYTIRQNIKLQRLNATLRSLNQQLQQLNQQLKDLNSDLKESNQVKEHYITQYLEVYSENIRRMTKLARRAGEKDPDAFMAKEMENFYHSFDTTFLSLYGNFVTDFNALLREDEGVWPKRDELLCTELRIFALIRLGIDSSAKIAELLCYSPNTIYNYRAKIKNAALGDRDTFEERVKQISAS